MKIIITIRSQVNLLISKHIGLILNTKLRNKYFGDEKFEV